MKNLNETDDPIAAPPPALPEAELDEPALEPELEARAIDGLPAGPRARPARQP